MSCREDVCPLPDVRLHGRKQDTFENASGEILSSCMPFCACAILVFRGSDAQDRTVLLILSGVAASVRPEEKKASKTPPLSLELSYIEDAAHPDIFKISKGQF